MHPDGCLFLALTHQLAGRSGEAPSPQEAAEVRRSVAYHVKDRVKASATSTPLLVRRVLTRNPYLRRNLGSH